MNSRRILFISPVPTHPQTAGNRTRIAALLQALIDLGHDVTFLFVRHEKGDEDAMRAAWGERFVVADWKKPKPPFTTRFRRRVLGRFFPDLRYSLDIDEWYDPSLDTVLRRLMQAQGFEVVLCNYVFFSRALSVFGPDVRKLIDTHDAFANRHRQYLARGEKPGWFSTSEAGEARAFGRADVVLAIQEAERQAFSARTHSAVMTISHITPVKPLPASAAIPGRMLFIASDNVINVHAINWFLDSVFPDVRRHQPHAHVALGGAICRAVEDRPGLVKLGRVEVLEDAYRAAALVINPVQFMTGLSIKNLEALGFGRALVSTPAGVEGMEAGKGVAFESAGSPAEFSAQCLRLLSDDSSRAALGTAAADYVLHCNSAIRKQLQQAITGSSDDGTPRNP